MSVATRTKNRNQEQRRKQIHQLLTNWQLYAMLLIPLAFLILFSYVPMYGVQIAFKDFNAVDGITGSEWAGLKYFEKFFTDYQCLRVIWNTLRISVYSLLASFPTAIIFALCINYLQFNRYRKVVQTVVYAPYLISTVVMVTIILQFFSSNGIMTNLLNALTGSEQDYMASAPLFDDIYEWTGIWQSTGFNSIIYIATLVGVDPEMHEAAIVDGASKWKRMVYIDLPSLMPTAVKLLILNVGQVLNIGYEKVLLMQNPLNLSSSEVISTYVYKVGLTSTIPQYSYSTAIGLFQSAIGMVLLIAVNAIANRINDSGLW